MARIMFPLQVLLMSLRLKYADPTIPSSELQVMSKLRYNLSIATIKSPYKLSYVADRSTIGIVTLPGVNRLVVQRLKLAKATNRGLANYMMAIGTVHTWI